jgi:hypothetical protein
MMQHAAIKAEFATERSRPLTHHGQPVTGVEVIAIDRAAIEREAAYGLALTLVRQIDNDLKSGRKHYRDRTGVLLLSLGEVLAALEGMGE